VVALSHAKTPIGRQQVFGRGGLEKLAVAQKRSGGSVKGKGLGRQSLCKGGCDSIREKI